MQQIIDFVLENWVTWLFAGAWAVSKISAGNIKKRLAADEAKSKAIATGVQAMLRDAIINNYNKYKDRGYIPIYARESVKKIYEAYEGLGGNDVAHDLYEKMRHWDTDPDDREEEHNHERECKKVG